VVDELLEDLLAEKAEADTWHDREVEHARKLLRDLRDDGDVPAENLKLPRSSRRRADVLPASLAPLGLSLDEVAAFIGISANKYRELEQRKRMPGPRLVDGRRLYDRELAHAAFKRLPTTTGNDHGAPLPHNDEAEDRTWDDLQ
jgi:hypothetical protein